MTNNVEEQFKSALQRISESRSEEKQLKERIIHNEDEYKKALNKMLNTPEGKMFYQYLVKYSGLYAVNTSLNAAQLLEDNGKKRFLLEMVRPFLYPETLTELEYKQ